MNRPLRYRGYTFYQSSYAEDGRGGESSTFSVVRNSGRWLPYVASALLFLGLAGHFLAMLAAALKKPRPAEERPHAMKKKICLALLAFWLLGASVLPAATSPLEPFRRLVVLEQGRKKPWTRSPATCSSSFPGDPPWTAWTLPPGWPGFCSPPSRPWTTKFSWSTSPTCWRPWAWKAKAAAATAFRELRPGLDRLHELAFQYANRGRQRQAAASKMRPCASFTIFPLITACWTLSRSPGRARRESRIRAAPPRCRPSCRSRPGPDEEWLSPAQAWPMALPCRPPAAGNIAACPRPPGPTRDGRRRFRPGTGRFQPIRCGSAWGPQAVRSGKISLEIFYNRLDPFSKAELAYGLALLLLLLSLVFQRRRLGAPERAAACSWAFWPTRSAWSPAC